MFFGLDIEKILLLGVLAGLLMGPERLPQAAQWLARMTVRVRNWSRTAKERLKEEMGDDLADVQWRQLDPRQYDPRRIIRQALLEEPAPLQRQGDAALQPTAVPLVAAPEHPTTTRVSLDPLTSHGSEPTGETPIDSAPEEPTERAVQTPLDAGAPTVTDRDALRPQESI